MVSRIYPFLYASIYTAIYNELLIGSLLFRINYSYIFLPAFLGHIDSAFSAVKDVCSGFFSTNREVYWLTPWLILTSSPTLASSKALALPPFSDTSKYPLLPIMARSPLPSA